MNHKELLSLDDSKWFNVVKPLKKSKSIKDNPVIIGWDSEFIIRNGQQELLCNQFATDTNACLNVVGLAKEDFIVIHPENYQYPAKIPLLRLGFDVLGFLQYYLEYKNEDIPDDIYLVSHFSQAEFSNIDNLNTAKVFQANKALSGSFEFEALNRKITIHNKDLIFSLSYLLCVGRIYLKNTTCTK